MAAGLRAGFFLVLCIAARADAAVESCPADKPLGAYIELNLAHSEPSLLRDSTARVWFELKPSPYVPPEMRLANPWSAERMTWRTTATACRDGPRFSTCSCPASRASGTADLSNYYATFDPSRPDLDVMFPDEIQDSGEVRVECVDGGNVVGEMGTSLGLPATFSVRARRAGADGIIEVDPTGCYDAEGRGTPDCVARPDRFARIPFAGSGNLTSRDGEFETIDRVRWEVCCGCGIPPRDGMEGEGGECGDSGQQRGLLEVAIAASTVLRADLRTRVARYEQEQRLAEQYRSDFELVSNSCAGWDVSIELMKFLLGGPGAPESAQTFVQLIDLVGKLADEDPSVLLNIVEGLPLDDAVEGALEFTFMGADDFSIGTLWDGADTVYGGALDASQAGSIPQMRQRLEECSGVPLVSNLVYDDAKLHLRHLEAMVRELPGIRALTTRIEQADTEVYNRWVAWHAACLEEAQCKGTDPAVCGPAPP